MKLIKRIILIITGLLLLGYLVFAIFVLNPKAEDGTVCHKMTIEVDSGGDDSYLDEEDIRKLITDAGLDPVEQSYANINTAGIEKLLEENKSVKRASCYKAVDGTVKVKVYQRVPLMRVMANTGDYYLDKEGELMPAPRNYAARVPLATGYISEEYARTELFRIAQYLNNNRTRSEEIEQIHVHKNKDIEITPRKGNHAVIMGKPEDWDENFQKLDLFYRKGLDKIGWNRYAVINLKYKNRVVCTKN